MELAYTCSIISLHKLLFGETTRPRYRSARSIRTPIYRVYAKSLDKISRLEFSRTNALNSFNIEAIRLKCNKLRPKSIYCRIGYNLYSLAPCSLEF